MYPKVSFLKLKKLAKLDHIVAKDTIRKETRHNLKYKSNKRYPRSDYDQATMDQSPNLKGFYKREFLAQEPKHYKQPYGPRDLLGRCTNSMKTSRTVPDHHHRQGNMGHQPPTNHSSQYHVRPPPQWTNMYQQNQPSRTNFPEAGNRFHAFPIGSFRSIFPTPSEYDGGFHQQRFPYNGGHHK